ARPNKRSGLHTPLSDWTEAPRKAAFDDDASIVLIGVRGVGKSSLGVLAATAYGRPLVEIDKVFLELTRSSPQTYRKLHGADIYHKKHSQILKRSLEAYDKDSVIICSFSDLEKDGLRIIRQYSESHAVIHVTRDRAGIQSHLQVWSLDRVQQLLRVAGPLLRSCANFEFFNLTEKLAETERPDAWDLAKAG
ncbi:hypothetical protein LTR53_018705, partial [Teratosphaeriaceae sp. CCFEE 6253]